MTPAPQFVNQAFKQFQLTTDINSKLDLEFGRKVANYVESSIMGVNSYYWLRNNRFKLNRQLANGTVDMSKFMDRLEMNGKLNFVNINWLPIHIVSTIISGLVGQWMERSEKIVVTAIDDLSQTEKVSQYKDAMFYMHEMPNVAKMQQASGLQLMKPKQFIPQNMEELDLWAAENNRLPEEILNEKKVNDIFYSNGFVDVNKQKLLHDSAEVGLVGTYTWMDEDGIIHIDIVKPENMIYFYDNYPDFRETHVMGQVKSLKISELRAMYGKPKGNLSEEEIWQIAQTSKEYQLNDKIRWVAEWNSIILRPYDEWNVDIIDFELRSLDKDDYTITKTKLSGSTILESGQPKTQGGQVRQKPLENQQYVANDKWNIYRCVYVRNNQYILEWGIKKNMVRPQDPKHLGQAEFSYAFFMYDNYEMRNLAVPEKIEEPVDQMIVARLKMQQLVAKMRPIGAAINVDAMQELDLGTATTWKPLDVQKIYDQTGQLYYRGRDAEGNSIPVPITELQNAGFFEQMRGLIEIYNFHYKVLIDELGVDPNLPQQAAQPRVTSDNVQEAVAGTANKTEYMYKAFLWVMEQTAEKVMCLLKTSVLAGAEVYRELMNERTVSSIYDAKARMLPTEAEIQQLNLTMQNAMQANPQLVLYCDPFKILRTAKEDVKLAQLYFQHAQRKAIQGQMQQAAAQSQYNANAQMQSLQMKAQFDGQQKELEGNIEIAKAKIMSEAQNKTAVVNMVATVISKAEPVPPYMQPLVNMVVQNIMLPLAAENQAQQQAAIAQMQQMAQAQQGQPPQGQGGQPPPPNGQQQQLPPSQNQPQQPSPQQAAA